jgi:hypothetical protein
VVIGGARCCKKALLFTIPSGRFVPDILILLLKAGFAIIVVVSATMVAERSGPFWGALITSLPVSMGPIYVVMAIDRSDEFIAASTLSSFAAHSAMFVFLATGAIAATRLRPALTMLSIITVWLLSVTAIHSVQWSIGPAIALNLVSFTVSLIAARLWARPGVAVPAPPQWFDLPLRAALVATLTITVSLTSAALGPKTSGIVAIFPVVFISATIVLLARLGGPATAAILARAVVPLVGLGIALLTAHLVTSRFGSAIGLSAGLAATLTYSVILILWHLRGPRALVGGKN